MGRPQVRLQTESKTNRRFVTIHNERDGTTSYPKVYLRTKNEEVARRRMIALDGVEDVEEARRRIDRLASATSPEQEKSRLADFLHRVVIGAELGPTSASKRDPPGSKEYPLGEGVQGILFLV